MSHLIQRLNGSNTTYGAGYTGNYGGTKKLYVRTSTNGILTYPLTTDTSASQYCKFKILVSANKTAYLAKSWSKTTTTWQNSRSRESTITTTTWQNSRSRESTITTTTWKNSRSRASDYITYETGSFSTWKISSTRDNGYNVNVSYSTWVSDYYDGGVWSTSQKPTNFISSTMQSISSTTTYHNWTIITTDTGPLRSWNVHGAGNANIGWKIYGYLDYTTPLKHRQITVQAYTGKTVSTYISYQNIQYTEYLFDAHNSFSSRSTLGAGVTTSWSHSSPWSITAGYTSHTYTTNPLQKISETVKFPSGTNPASYTRKATIYAGTYSYTGRWIQSLTAYKVSYSIANTEGYTFTSTNKTGVSYTLSSSTTKTTKSGNTTRSSGYTETSTAAAGTSLASGTITSGTRSSGYTETSTAAAGTSITSGTTTSGTRSSGYTETSTAAAGTSLASGTTTSGTRSSGYTETSNAPAGTSITSGTTTSGTTHNANI